MSLAQSGRHVALGAAIALALYTTLAGQASEVELNIRARSFTPGEGLVLDIGVPRSARTVEVRAFDRSTRAYATSAGRWQAIVGIDLDQKPGSYTASVIVDGRPAADDIIAVEDRSYPVRRLKVNPDFVNPPKSVEARIVEESQLMARVYAHPAAERLWSGGFARPVPHRANSRFGTRSVFNGQPRSPHTGTDFLSPAGTPIRAPQAGRAVVARDLYFSGQTVIIDHGLGVFSQLAHMSRIDAVEGEMVESGQVVGLVGATGRVTGAHLHWGMRVNGARVDPLSLVALLPTDKTP